MNSMRFSLLFAVILIAYSALGWAETKDSASKLSTGEETDARLSQKVTYDSGNKRLHLVVDDLSQMSGVSIACGKNKSDWHVRDIPVVVCVKDVTLGKLLQSIADATHTTFASEKIDGSPTIRYRIYRTPKAEKEVSSFFDRKHEAALSQATWCWDVLTEYGKSAEIPGVPKSYWLTGKLIASLGSDAEDKLLDGDTLRIGSQATTREAINGLYRLAWEHMKPEGVNYTPTDADMMAATLRIKLVDTGDSARIIGSFGPLNYGDGSRSYWREMPTSSGLSNYLAEKLPSIQPYPYFSWTDSGMDKLEDRGFFRLSNQANEWEQPFLKAKFDLELPKELETPSFADMISRMSSVSGCNIVVEDFASILEASRQQVASAFVKNTTIANTLDNCPGLWKGSIPYLGPYCWFSDEKEKLLVGWPYAWHNLNCGLLPEEYLNFLKQKLNGPGVEFDDAVHFANLSSWSFVHWICQNKDLECLGQVHIEEPFWKLYDLLTPEDKQLAQSKDGLALHKLDGPWVADFLKTQRKALQFIPEDSGKKLKTDLVKEKLHGQLALKEIAIADPSIFSRMTMRVQKTPVSRDAKTSEKTGELLDQFKYSMTLEYEEDDQQYQIAIESPSTAFPIWSTKRKEELLKSGTANKGTQ